MSGIEVPGLLQQAQEQQAPQESATLVTTHDGMVVLHFQQPCEYAAYAPVGAISDGAKLILGGVEADDAQAQLAINVAMAMIDGIYELRGDLKPASGPVKHELIERHRRTLTQRLSVVLNSTREKKTTSNRGLAKQLVDIMLSEVFS